MDVVKRYTVLYIKCKSPFVSDGKDTKYNIYNKQIHHPVMFLWGKKTVHVYLLLIILQYKTIECLCTPLSFLQSQENSRFTLIKPSFSFTKIV